MQPSPPCSICSHSTLPVWKLKGTSGAFCSECAKRLGDLLLSNAPRAFALWSAAPPDPNPIAPASFVVPDAIRAIRLEAASSNTRAPRASSIHLDLAEAYWEMGMKAASIRELGSALSFRECLEADSNKVARFFHSSRATIGILIHLRRLLFPA